MRHTLAIVLGLGLFACHAHAVIEVRSAVSVTDGVRAQAVITNKSSPLPNVAVSIKEIHAAILIRDDNIQNGLQVTKRQLTAQQAYGQGLPLGYQVPPFTDPEGPWFGLVWPYRDQYDYFPNQFDPLGDDVGIFFQDQPGIYGFVDIDGIARGGPTDPVPPPGSSDPEWLARGITGNGLTGPATYFNIDIIPLVGPFDRTITLQIFAASCIVVQRDTVSGEFSEIEVKIPDFQTTIQLPEPSLAITSTLLSLLALRRRR